MSEVSFRMTESSPAPDFGELPPCGIYVTTQPIGDVPAGRLVYFHNHGDPGPGVYLPERWNANRAVFRSRGQTLPDRTAAEHLRPLPAEGFYRVVSEFPCCDKRCRVFPPDQLVQLGYDGAGTPIVFEPTWTDSGLTIPENGVAIDRERLTSLAPLKTVGPTTPTPTPTDGNYLH